MKGLRDSGLPILLLLLAAMPLSATTISQLQLSAQTGTSATITWTTDVPSSTQVWYGTGQQFNSTPVNPALVTSHTVTLINVTNATTYSYYAVSVDVSNNKATSPIQQFTVCLAGSGGTGLTNVQGTINNYYEYGDYTFTWSAPAGFAGTPTVCGAALTTTFTGNLDQGASLSLQIPDSNQIVPSPSQWSLAVSGINGAIGLFTINQAITPQGNNLTVPLQLAAAGNLIHVWYDPNTATFYPPVGGGGANYPPGTGIPQVTGGAAWGTTLTVLGSGSSVATASSLSGTLAPVCWSSTGLTTSGCNSGDITGTGTAGFVPLWNGSTSLGNSPTDYNVTHAGAYTLGAPVYTPTLLGPIVGNDPADTAVQSIYFGAAAHPAIYVDSSFNLNLIATAGAGCVEMRAENVNYPVASVCADEMSLFGNDTSGYSDQFNFTPMQNGLVISNSAGHQFNTLALSITGCTASTPSAGFVTCSLTGASQTLEGSMALTGSGFSNSCMNSNWVVQGSALAPTGSAFVIASSCTGSIGAGTMQGGAAISSWVDGAGTYHVSDTWLSNTGFDLFNVSTAAANFNETVKVNSGAGNAGGIFFAYGTAPASPTAGINLIAPTTGTAYNLPLPGASGTGCFFFNGTASSWTTCSGGLAGLTTNVLIKAGSATTGVNSQVTDDGTDPVVSPDGYNIAMGIYSYEIANAGTTGTTVNDAACDNGSGQAIVCPHTTSTTNQVMGFVQSGAGTTGNATLCQLGYCQVKFDNASVARHYAINSTTVDGELHDTGSTTPPSGQPFFFVWTPNSGAGTVGQIRMLLADDFNNASPTAVYALQVNAAALTAGDTVNFNNTTPAADSGYQNIHFKTSKSGTTDSISGEDPLGSASVFGLLECGSGTTCTSGVISVAGSAFSAITSGTNTTAAMVLGTGSSLTVSGSGTNNATSIGGIAITGTPSVGYVPTATSSSAATWQAASAGGVTSLTGDGTIFSNSASTGAVTLTKVNASAHNWLGNNGGSTAAPAYGKIGASDVSPNTYAADTGTQNALVVNLAPAATSLQPGLSFRTTPAFANTLSNPTVNLNGLGAVAITYPGGAALNIGDLQTNEQIGLTYDGITSTFDIETGLPCGEGYTACRNTPNTFFGGTQTIDTPNPYTVAGVDEGNYSVAAGPVQGNFLSGLGTVAFPSAVSSGNTEIVIVSANTATTPTISDTLGLTFTLQGTIPAFGMYSWVFTAYIPSGGSDSVTVAGPGAIWGSVISEYYGLASSPYDGFVGTNLSSGVTNPQSFGPVSTSGAADLLLAYFATNGNAVTASVHSPFVNTTIGCGLTGCPFSSYTGYSTGNAAGSYSATWTNSVAAQQTQGFILALKAVAAHQTADLRQWKSDAGVPLAAINATGIFVTKQSANTDQAGVLALSSATSASYTFTPTVPYLSHPVCFGSPDADPGSGVRWYITYTSTTSFTVNFTSAYTGNFDYGCFPRN